MTDCLFCRIAAGEIPADIVYEDDDTFAFRDIQPCAPVHVLVIPRRHIAGLDVTTDEDVVLLGKITRTAARVAEIEGISETGFRCAVNTSSDARQTVRHLHLHVLGGRKMGWPPG